MTQTTFLYRYQHIKQNVWIKYTEKILHFIISVYIAYFPIFPIFDYHIFHMFSWNDCSTKTIGWNNSIRIITKTNFNSILNCLSGLKQNNGELRSHALEYTFFYITRQWSPVNNSYVFCVRKAWAKSRYYLFNAMKVTFTVK